MPRRARIVYPHHLHHVTQRGNYRQDVFEDDQDRVTYLKYVEEKRVECGINIYVFCLMDNHVHFLVKPEKSNSMAEFFRTVHMKYSHYYNRKKKQKGHLWQGRFYFCLVSGTHIKEVFRYIENNSVRAKMVSKAWHYSWSSARAHLGKRYRVVQLSDAREFLDIGNWKYYLEDREDDRVLKQIRIKLQKGLVLAAKEFISRMETRLGIKIQVNSPGRPKNSVCP